MENIQIFDNFLNETEINILKDIIKKNKWTYGHTSITDYFTVPFWYSELIENDYLKYTLKSKIEDITQKKYEVVRVYMNGQTFGQHGSYHQDDVNEFSYTFCLYFTEFDSKIEDIVGGNFEIKLPNVNNYHISITPIFNRAILFPSNYYHKGNAFDRYVSDLRICIAYKLRLCDK